MRTRKSIRSCRPGLLGRLPAYLLGAILSTGMVFSIDTYAVHDVNVFELDNGTKGANAIDESNIGNADASAPDDWAQTGNCPAGLASCGYVSGPTVDPDNPGGSAFKSLYIQDPNGVANTDDIFTGGGSKDDLDVKQWLTKRGSTPDKDDLLPLGAAAYLKDLSDDDVDNPDLLIYLFGSLFAPNGDAAIGAWLFKKDIGICDDGIGGNDTDGFGVVDDSGNCLPPAQQPLNLHTIGDVFVVAQNVSGGREVIMEVYKWVDENNEQGQDTAAATAAKAACVDIFPNSNKGGVVNNTLCLMFAAENAHCDTLSLANDDACGTMNLGETKGQNAQPAVPTESPDDWGFQSKFPPAAGPASPPGTDGIQSDDFPGTSLFEAGFNFSNLFPGAVGCFNSFLMNTRASQSVDAVLKDIGLGKFPLCGISVSKSGPEKSKIGDDADFTFTITNTGAITLYLDTVVDDVLGDLEAAAVAAGCATLAAGASCEFTVTRAIPDGSPDPLVNTVTVHYNSAQSLQGDDQTSTASHNTNLFQPSITFDKAGDALSKASDTTHYTITLNNTSSDDTPDLVCTISDPLLGLDEEVTLASGASHVINTNYLVQAGDSDPLLNTASVTCSPTGFPNIYTKSDEHSTNLFQPSITLDKTGTELSKVGDPVNYTITLSNTSSADSPALNCTLSDALLGISETVTLASGASKVINKQYIVQASDPDPLPNTATATCSPDGFPNVLTADDSHNVNLFQPSVDVVKEGDLLSKVGDPASYTITVTNTSSDDSPALVNGSIVDTVLGDLLAANPYVTGSTCTGSLATGASCTINATRIVQPGDADPLPNTVTVHYNPSGFPNDITDSDSHSVNLFQPSIVFGKTGDALSKATDTTNYTITLDNTSSADTPDLVCTISDALLGIQESVTLAAGASHVINQAYVVQLGDPDPLLNTATVTCSPTGFPNVYEAADSHSTNLFQPSITLDKTGDAMSKVGDPVNYTITLGNTSSADSPDLTCTISDALLGIDEQVVLAAGGSHVINKQYIVQPGDTDPLPNTATATCSPAGFPNVLQASDEHIVELIQPSVDVVKEGDLLSKVGDPANYTITVSNTSSADSPALTNGSIVDTLLGDLLDPANPYVTGSDCTSSLATGASCTINASRTVQAGDADPLPNIVTVHYNPSGFSNDISDSDDHSVNLFQPSVALDKSANCELDVIVGQTITYSYAISNTGSADSPDLNLASIVDDKLGDLAAQAAAANCDTLASGASCNFTVQYVTEATDVGAPIVNTVDVHYNPAGFPNDISAQDQQSCNVVLPNPATVVIEKLLLDAENLAFDYSATGLAVPGFQLVPLYGQLPLANSPFADPLAGQSFASSIEFTVDIPSFGATEQATVTEDEPLPPFISAVSLTCAAADGGTLTGQSVAGLTATLTLGSGDFAFCRYVNQFNPGEDGCTPGYWKQEQHFGSWTNPPYDPYSTQLQDVFNFAGVNGQIGGLADDLMLDALSYQGGTGKLGAARIMLRAAVAAVLNAANGGVQYAFSLNEVISDVNAQLQSGTRDSMLALATQLDDANNGVFDNPDGGESCPLGRNPL